MAFNRSDNARNEGSGRPKRQYSEGGNNQKKDFSSRGRSSASNQKDSGTDRPRRTYGDSPSGEVKRFASSGSKPYSKRQGDSERSRDFGGDKKRPYSGRPETGDRPAKNFGDKPARNFSDKPKRDFGDKPARTYGDRPQGKRPYGTRDSEGGEKRYGDRPARNFGDSPRGKRPYGSRDNEGGEKRFGDKPSFGSRKPAGRDGFQKKEGFRERSGEGSRERSFDRGEGSERPRYNKSRSDRGDSFERPSRRRDDDRAEKPERTMRGRNKKQADTGTDENGQIRLNRYISNAGICSRRKADELISAGVISVNGEVISELGYKVNPMKDVIRYNGETLKREKMVYVLLNKPKDYITTTDDPQERRTVMHLVEKASKERIYPIGRLDRNTTGLLLMTNDGDLADKLSHPKNNITKIYQIELNKNLTQGDLNKIGFGVELEDGFIKPDMVSYVSGGTKREVGIQIHSGKNRIVRRIFESLGYEVVKLDRVVYANLTKKDLPRGRWRFLEEQEIIQLKHLI